MKQSIREKANFLLKVSKCGRVHISKHLSCSSHVFTKKRKPISEFSQINPAKSRQGLGLGALGALRALAALHSNNLADINVKEIQIILRLFLVITMYHGGVRQHCYKKKAATVGQNGRLSALCNFFSF